jgi:hypothetical protein
MIFPLPENFTNKSIQLLEVLSEQKNLDLFRVPAIKHILNSKWQMYGRWFMMRSTLAYFFVLISLVVFTTFGRSSDHTWLKYGSAISTLGWSFASILYEIV